MPWTRQALSLPSWSLPSSGKTVTQWGNHRSPWGVEYTLPPPVRCGDQGRPFRVGCPGRGQIKAKEPPHAWLEGHRSCHRDVQVWWAQSLIHHLHSHPVHLPLILGKPVFLVLSVSSKKFWFFFCLISLDGLIKAEPKYHSLLIEVALPPYR